MNVLYSMLESVSGLIPAILGTTVSAVMVRYLSEKLGKRDEAELQKLSNEREEINQKIDNKNEFNIYDTIRLNLNQLNEYYTINKAQAKSSFISSLVAIIIGLITIIIGIGIQYYGTNLSITTSVITSVSGILLEFIGGAYFFMYKKSLEQVNFFFAQLIKIQDTMLAINLAKEVASEDKSTELTEKIVASLLERSLK
jgi:hypothetical protein